MVRRLDIVAVLEAIRETTRDPRGHPHFIRVEAYSYTDELLRSFGEYYRSQLAIVRDRMGWHQEQILACEQRAKDQENEDPNVLQAVAEAAIKHRGLLLRWQEEEQRVVALIDALEQPFWSFGGSPG